MSSDRGASPDPLDCLCVSDHCTGECHEMHGQLKGAQKAMQSMQANWSGMVEQSKQKVNEAHLERDAAYDLLRRVRWAMNEGYDEIPDVAHAICEEITEMVGDE